MGWAVFKSVRLEELQACPSSTGAEHRFLAQRRDRDQFFDHTGSEIFLGERSAHRSLLWLFVSGWSRIGGHPL